MDAAETNAATGVKIVTSDGSLTVEQTVALPELTKTMESRLEDLVAEHEATAFEPVRLDPGPRPLYVPIEELWALEEAQLNAYDQMKGVYRQAKADQDKISADLKADLVVQRKREITMKARETVREIYASMAPRAQIAQATRRFFEPNAVRRRARFDKSDQAHYGATVSWISRLSAASPLALPGFAEDAVALGDLALSALVIENLHGRGSSVSDRVRHDVENIISTLELQESVDGLGLADSIVILKRAAESEMRTFETGRTDEMMMIEMGLAARARAARLARHGRAA
jgi:hypothetical protein